MAEKYAGVTELKLGEAVMIGGFKVQPIDVPHSCQNYAYIIEHSDFGKLLFCTDCTHFKWKIKNCNHVLLECNWSEEILLDNLCNDSTSRSHHEHHMELSETIKSLKANYSSDLMTVCLIHLSGGNADAEMFQKRVKEELGFENVYCAEKGLEIPLQLSEF